MQRTLFFALARAHSSFHNGPRVREADLIDGSDLRVGKSDRRRWSTDPAGGDELFTREQLEQNWERNKRSDRESAGDSFESRVSIAAWVPANLLLLYTQFNRASCPLK